MTLIALYYSHCVVLRLFVGCYHMKLNLVVDLTDQVIEDDGNGIMYINTVDLNEKLLGLILHLPWTKTICDGEMIITLYMCTKVLELLC